MRLAATLSLVLALAAPAIAAADPLTPAKRADIARLIAMAGGSNIAGQFAAIASRQFFGMLKASQPQIPDRAIAIMEREMNILFTEQLDAPGGLTEMVVPIYDRHFTHEELRGIIAFYETPVGRKAITVLPQVMQESMLAGQRWGQALGPEIERRVLQALRREGLLPGPRPAPGT
jgi:hypothetical protein